MSRTWAFMERVDVPHVDNPTENFMVRWRVVQTPWFGVYVHRFNTRDPRSTLHTHPWPFVSLILRGGYTENAERRDERGRVRVQWSKRTHRPGSVQVMRKRDAHSIAELRRSPTWTLVFVGRRQPEPSWGYWDDDMYVPFDEHEHFAEFQAAMAAREAMR